MIDIKPEISIIVSVYNAGSTLVRCMESLVYQSLDNIEVIVVDKASTDHSREIAELYQTNFPDKVRVFERPYSENLVSAYNFGVLQAKSDYLAFADADDWYELTAMEVILEQIHTRSPDIIYYPWRVLGTDGKQIRIAGHPREETVEAQLFSNQMCTYWCRIIRKSLFCKYLPIPEVDGPDANFLPVIISNALSFASIPTPLYNYVAGIGETSRIFAPIRHTIPKGWDYLLTYSNLRYMDYIVFFIARRVDIATRKFWPYKWEYIKWLKEHANLFSENHLLKDDIQLYKKILNYINTDTTMIPLIVYINGFGKTNCEEREKNIQDTVFCHDKGKIVILDEKNCDTNKMLSLQAAYEEKRYEYLCHYFALENIYQTGGFFVGDQIRFTGSFSPVLDKASVFSYITTQTFSSEIWGARPGNEVIRELLRTYQTPDFYEDKYYPLSDRIRNILVARYDVPLNGRTRAKEDVYFIVDARMFVLNDGTYPFVCEHDFSAFVGQDEYKVIPVDIAFPTNLTSDQKIKQLTRERNKLKSDLSRIYHSDSWKLIKRIKKFANTFLGHPLKKIFKKTLRIYRKIKYGI